MFRSGVMTFALAVAISAAAQPPVPDQKTAAQDSQSPVSAANPQPTTSPVPDSTSLVIVKMVRPTYPLAASTRGIQGQVKFKLHISETGDVEQVEPIEGDSMLMSSAVDAAKKWKFQPYVKNGKPIKVVTTIPFDFAFGDKIRLNVPPDDKSTVATNPDGTARPTRVKVAQGVAQGLLLRQVVPVYPPDARATRIEGQVLMSAVIGKDGRVQGLHVLRGHPMLVDAARGAVQQWRYRPYMLKGEPIEVETQIIVNFTLR